MGYKRSRNINEVECRELGRGSFYPTLFLFGGEMFIKDLGGVR